MVCCVGFARARGKRLIAQNTELSCLTSQSSALYVLNPFPRTVSTAMTTTLEGTVGFQFLPLRSGLGPGPREAEAPKPPRPGSLVQSYSLPLPQSNAVLARLVMKDVVTRVKGFPEALWFKLFHLDLVIQ